MHKNSEQKVNISKLFCQGEWPKLQNNSQISQDLQKVENFKVHIDVDIIDQVKLCEMAWTGVPHIYRFRVWPILLRYMSTNKEAKDQIVAYKRKQYQDMQESCFNDAELLDAHEVSAHDLQQKQVLQVIVNEVRGIKLEILKQQKMQIMLVRILFMWSTRNPQISFNRNLCTLLLPFLVAYVDINSPAPTTEELRPIEADLYWCFTLFLDPAKKYFITLEGDGTATQALTADVEKVLKQMNPGLINHLKKESFDLNVVIQRWIGTLMLNLFAKEFRLRIYDTLISEGQVIEMMTFLVYFICAVILKFSNALLKLTKMQIFKLLLEDLQTREWNIQQLEMLFSEAYSYKTIYHQK